MDDGLANLSASDKRELLARLLRERAAAERGSEDHSDASPREFPMSAGQQGLWYAFRRDPTITAYNVFMPSRFRSPVDLDAMRRSIETLVTRHSCLRTVFAESSDGNHPIQRVLASSPPEFRVVDATGWKESDVQEAIQREVARPFDLTTGPLLRFAVVRIAEDNLVMVAHNVEVGNDTLLCGLVGIAGSTKIGNNVVLAGKVGVTD
ncbi:MAG: condensation domain-containing protein, partial [Planctomycetota bacterium]